MLNRIRELREESKMTQIRLSMELEVTQETVSAYELGKHYPGVNTLIKLAVLFNASIDYILGRSNIKKAEAETILTRDEVSLVSMYRKLNPLQKERVCAFIQGQLSCRMTDFINGER